MFRIFKGFLIFLGIAGVLISIGFIFNYTIPSVHDFFINSGKWIVNLFKK